MTMEIKTDIWFVYDGECPVCQMGASFFKVRQSTGNLHAIDARSQHDHPIMAEINAAGLNLDDGMVIQFNDTFYHGRDALHLMAQIGDEANFHNRLNAGIFRSKILCTLCYPFMRGARDILLAIKGVKKIRNLDR